MSDELLKSLFRPEQKTAIFELEGLAVVTAFKGFSKMMRGKRLVVFTDNQGVQSSLVKCKSLNESMDLIIRKICSFEESFGIISWIEKVPSQSNPSDGLWREVTKTCNGKVCTPIDLSEVWQECQSECSFPSLQVGGEARG